MPPTATQDQVKKTGNTYDTPVGVGGRIDTKTGQLLPSSISSASLTPQAPIQLPQPPAPTNYGGAIANAGAVIDANTSGLTSLFDKYMAAQPTPPSASDTYDSLYKTSGIDQQQADFNAKQEAVRAAQGKLTGVTARIAGLNAEAAGAQIAQEGRQAPMFAISGEQGAIDRARAIKAIPLQVEALTTQAEVANAQGDAALSQSILQQAQSHLDTVFQLHMADATAQYNYKTKVLDSVYQFATDQEKARLATIAKQQDQAFQVQQNNIKFAQDVASKAAQTAADMGDTSLFTRLAGLDPNSPTYTAQLSQIASQVYGNTAPAGGTSDPVTAASQAILGNESNGDYTAKSPALPGGHRSYGKYQVLDSNIPSFTKTYFGQSLTPEQFLANPAAQEAVQRGYMSELWNKYGNIQDVASVYFTGVPYATAVAQGRKDQATGMTVQQYVAKAAASFTNAIGSSQSTGSPLSQAVKSNPALFFSLPADDKTKVLTELQNSGYDVAQLRDIKLTASQQDDIAAMNTVSGLVDKLLAYNSDGKLEGIGVAGVGTVKSLLAQVGIGSKEGQDVRALIGNIKGTIAKLRGGTSFTANEEKLLNSYTPTINDAPSVAINKLHLLKDFIAQKNGDVISAANTNPNAAASTVDLETLRAKYGY